jgi:enterobacterial common antigen flippase
MKSTYREIFKATSIVGGTQVLVLLIGMLKSKVLAVLVGPVGTGLTSLYSSTTTLVGIITGLGIRNSGVRHIARANASGDKSRLARTVVVLRWTVRATGLVGGLVVLIFCKPLSHATFGDNLHVVGMAFMSLVLVFDGISNGQYALLQGMRRIGDLAKCKITGAVLGTITSVVILWYFREDGIVPIIILGSFFAILISWLYARKIHVEKVTLTKEEVGVELKSLAGLGVASLVAGLTQTATAYITRVLLTRDIGIAGVGIYNASLALSTVFVTYVGDAMGMDLFPRLSAVADNDKEMNRMVNEQTEMGLLLCAPALLIIFVLSPLFIRILYSAAYLEAVDVLRWQIIASTLRVVTWPIGTVQLAKARKDWFITTEVSYGVGSTILLYIGIQMFGLVGAGIAAFVSNILLVIAQWAICRHLTGFNWSRGSVLMLLALGVSSFAVYLCVTLLSTVWGMIAGTGVAILVGVWCVIRLKSLLQVDVLAFLKSKLKR